MNDIPIDRVGQILRSKHPQDVNRFVKVQDDTKGSTGGFYILSCDSRDFKSSFVFDNWVEKREQLAKFFEAWEWEVKWF
jgi:hypothetical protein